MTINLPDDVSYIINRLNEAGYEAYAVCGCVRDSFLGRPPQDWDITTSALPEQTKSLFNRTVDTGIAHGTVTVMLKGEGYEVTTYRIDGKYSDCRHPDSVAFTRSLSDDLERRDFTINAMAYGSSGEVDLFGGCADLEAGIIRCVGDPRKRFGEDALRILRAVRFSAQLGFEIEPATRSAATELAHLLSGISAERIHAELNKLLLSPFPDRLQLITELGIDKVIFPELTAFNGDLEYVTGLLEHAPCDRCIRWAILLLHVGIAGQDCSGYGTADYDIASCLLTARRIMNRLKFDNYTSHRVCELIRLSSAPLSGSDTVSMRHLMNDAGGENMEQLFAFRRAIDPGADLDAAEGLCRQITEAGECICIKELAVSGRDLMELGIPAGARIGEILDALLDMVLTDSRLNTKDTLLRICKEDFLN